MSKINGHIRRVGDSQTFVVNLNLRYTGSYEYAEIEFFCSGQAVHCLSTTSGSISGDTIRLIGKEATINLEYSDIGDRLECLVGYYLGQNLVHSEALILPFDNSLLIKNTSTNIPCIGTICANYDQRLRDFEESAKRYRSAWKLHVSFERDLILNFIQKGLNQTFVVFGEESYEMLASDFVFQIDTQCTTISIPYEIIINRVHKYHPGALLGIYEIIKPDFVGEDHVFFKTLISNKLPLNGLLK